MSEIVESLKESVTDNFLRSLSFVVAFGWNEAVKAAMNKYYPLKKESIPAKFTYAVIVTCLVAGVVYCIG